MHGIWNITKTKKQNVEIESAAIRRKPTETNAMYFLWNPTQEEM